MDRNRKKKIILGIVFCGVVALSILFLATQYIAYTFGYQGALGAPVMVYDGTPLYWPWQSILWAIGFGQRFPTPFLRAYGLIGLALFMVTMLAIGARRRWLRNMPEFGKDKWGTKADATKAGLFSERGVVCGLFDDQLMIYDGPEHHLLSGASRSGKGVGHVIPTLLSWHQSVLVYDIKNELHDDTAGYRSQFSDIIRFNPTDPASHRFNPLLEVRHGAHEIRDVQNIVEIIADPSGNKDDQNIWDENAKQFLVALILHVLYTAPDSEKSLPGVRARMLDFDATIDAMMHTGHRLGADGQPEVHPEIYRVARSLAGKSERFRSSVKGTAEGYLTLYADETVAANVSTSDFRLGDLMCSTNPVSFYIQPPPSDQARLRPLIRLLVNQLCRTLMEHKNKDGRGRPKRHKLLLCMDEFPTLGRLDFFQTNMGQMAGYGIKALLIVQSFNHIERAYGADNVIIDNCHVLVAFASADTRTQDRISQMTGESREYRLSYSQPRSLFANNRHTISQGEQQRRLLQPGDVRELTQDKQLVFITGYPPFRTDKLRFYEHAGMLRLTQIPAPAADRTVLAGLAINDWQGMGGTGEVRPDDGEEVEADADTAEYHGGEAEPEADDDDEFMI